MKYLLLALFLIFIFCIFFVFKNNLVDSYEQEVVSVLRLEGVTKKILFSSNKNQDLSMLFVGDIMLSRDVERIMKREKDWRFPFRDSYEVLQGADIVVGNLEGPVSSRGTNQGSIYSFRADPSVIDGLKYAGFDVLSLANNHIFDWGRDAIIDTIYLLDNSGIQHVGVGKNYEEANKPAVLKKNGYFVSFFSFTNLYPETLFATKEKGGISEYNKENIKKTISDAREKYDVVVVLLHWGNEYETVPEDWQREVGRSFVDSGADLVVGHHPHVPQEVENYKNGIIAYSLGNFVFDQNFSKETMSGLALNVVCGGAHSCNARKMNVLINKDFQPKFLGL